jgi:UDP:flavonoid glycosyltransferase YjiC (YdhE family)
MPLVPLARAFADRGDQVVFATAAGFAERVGAFGFDLLPAGLDNAELGRRYAPYRERLEAIPFADRRPYALSWRFGTVDAPAKVHDLFAQVTAWAPDLIVHETADLAAPAVAEAAGVRSVHHTFGLGLPQNCLDRMVPVVAPLWTSLGLEPAADAGLFRGTYIDVSPPGLHPAAPPDGTPVIALQPATPGAPSEEWRDRLTNERPVVYVTLGTQFNQPDRFAVLLEALSLVDCTALLTVGADRDPDAFEPPPNVIVERYIPQGDVLPLADAVLCHGGSGSTLAALAHGLPLVLLPAGADQFENAAACAKAGAAIELRPPVVTVDAIRVSLVSVLGDPAYAGGAKGLADEIRAMRTPAEAAAILS